MNDDVTSQREQAWQAVKASVVGSSHMANGRPSQDRAEVLTAGGSEVTLLAAVADGHGGMPHPFSDIGAQFAVEEGIMALRRFIQRWHSHHEIGPIRHAASKELPTEIVERWRGRVDEHLRNAAAEPGANGKGPRDGLTSHQQHHIAFGTTLIAVGACASFLLTLQIGDGEVVAVAPDGRVSRLSPDSGQILSNVTASLCTRDATKDVGVAVLPMYGQVAPELLILTTDGYPNCFASEEDFFSRTVTDYFTLVREHGLKRVGDMLEEWLTAASTKGSGDDCSLILALRSV